MTPYELLEMDYLSPIRFFSPPTNILYKNLKKSASTGDYTIDSLYKEVNKKHIYGNFKKYFNKYGLGNNTITFCVNVDHSMKVEKTLKELNQNNIFRIDCYLPDKEQRAIKTGISKAQLVRENFHIINVNMFSTGMDIPELDVGFMLRPTKSVVLWDQQVGRLTRKCEGKDCATIIDFTKNSETHGNMFQIERKAEINGPAKNKIISKYKICPDCYYTVKIIVKECPRV